MSEVHVCPRRREVFSPADHTEDHWREGNTCSFCGSLNPDEFMAALESGDVELGATDKEYKVYVHRPNPNAGKRCIIGYTNQKKEGWTEVTEQLLQELLESGEARGITLNVGDSVMFGAQPSQTNEKFYFQHLSSEQRDRFIELINAKKVKIGYPGYFYRLPFFCRPAA